MPSVSVIIPAKNRSAELAEALASLRAQTCSDWEAVVVDDASSEDLAAVVAEQADERIRYVKLPEGRTGAPAGRNYGFSLTSAPLVLYFDSDDILAPDAIRHRLAFLQDRPDLDFAVWACQQFRFRPGDLPLLWNQLIKPGVNDFDRYLCRDNPWQSASPLWRRSFLEKVGGWDEAALSGQDWEFPLRALLLHPKYEKFAEVDHFWRIAAGNRPSIGKSAGMDKSYTRAWSRTVLRVCDKLKREGLLDGPGSDVTRQRLGVVVWEAALRLADRVNARDGRSVWREARRRRLVTARRYREGWMMLALRRSVRLQQRMRQHLMLSWPRAYFFPQSATFNKLRLPDAPPPRVSIVVATRNNVSNIDEAMRSVLRQSFRDIEILVCDAGSTDGTVEFLKRHAEGDRRLRLIPLDGTDSSPWTCLLAAARGDLIAPMEGDYLAHAERIEREVAFLEVNPDVVVVGSQCRDVDAFDVDLPYEPVPARHEEIESLMLQGHAAIHHSACMFRRTAFNHAGGYRSEAAPAETLDLLLRLIEQGRAANLDDLLVRHRLVPDRPRQLEGYGKAADRVVEEARQRRGSEIAVSDAGRNPGAQAEPRTGQPLEWGWHALQLGRLDAARGHSLSALRRRPLSPGAWRLFFSAIRGN